MQSITGETMKCQSDPFPTDNSTVDEDGRIIQPRIVIVGCGGAGNNIVNRLYHMGYSGGETIAIDMSREHLNMIQADRKVLIGASLIKSLDDGNYPDGGKRAAEMARPMLENCLQMQTSASLPQAWADAREPLLHRSLPGLQKNRAPLSSGSPDTR